MAVPVFLKKMERSTDWCGYFIKIPAKRKSIKSWIRT